MKKCVVCSFDKVLLWLGGSIGTPCHRGDCNYVGPVILEAIGVIFEGQVNSKNLFKAGKLWSETGMGNRSPIKT